MRKLTLIIIVILISARLVGQYSYTHPEIFYMPAVGPEKYYADKLNDNISDNPGLQYRLQTGMFFNSINSFNSLTSWFSPKVLLPVNSKFMIEVGGTFSTTSLYGSQDGMAERVNNLITYARGVFSVNENLTVYGQVAKSMINNQDFNKDGYESITMGMEYYVTPNFRIGASVTSQKGFDPFLFNSRYPYGQYRPGFGPYY